LKSQRLVNSPLSCVNWSASSQIGCFIKLFHNSPAPTSAGTIARDKDAHDVAGTLAADMPTLLSTTWSKVW
jgi:hypothetical protein